jgi:hypothetical protein
MQHPLLNVKDGDHVCDVDESRVAPNRAQPKPGESNIDVIDCEERKCRWDEDWEKKVDSIWLGDIQGHARDER